MAQHDVETVQLLTSYYHKTRFKITGKYFVQIKSAYNSFIHGGYLSFIYCIGSLPCWDERAHNVEYSFKIWLPGMYVLICNKDRMYYFKNLLEPTC